MIYLVIVLLYDIHEVVHNSIMRVDNNNNNGYFFLTFHIQIILHSCCDESKDNSPES